MGLVHVKLDDEIEEILRMVVPSKRGELGKFVGAAVVEKVKRDFPVMLEELESKIEKK